MMTQSFIERMCTPSTRQMSFILTRKKSHYNPESFDKCSNYNLACRFTIREIKLVFVKGSIILKKQPIFIENYTIKNQASYTAENADQGQSNVRHI